MSATLALLLTAACTVGEGLDSAPQGSGGDGIDAAPGAQIDAGADAAPTADASPLAADATPGEPTARTVLEDFGECMSLADWEAEGLGQLALIQTNLGTCASCHNNGNGGNYMIDDSTAMFDLIKTYPYVLKYATVDADLTPVVSQAIPNKQNAGAGHPIFTLPADLAQAIIDFFDLTNARYIAGGCPPAQ